MPKQLSKEKIDKLFSFVESKNVVYKDVQYEIVDHLATAIEEEQVSDPSLSFNSALQRIYGKFPITGFASLVSAKEDSLKTFWSNRIFSLLLSYLKLPRLLLILATVYTLQFVISNCNTINLFALYFTIFVLSISFRIYNHKFGFTIDKKLTNQYLAVNSFTTTLEKFSFFNLIFIIPIVWISGSKIGAFTSIENWNLAFWGTLILVWKFACKIHLPKVLMKELSQKYRHLNIKLS